MTKKDKDANIPRDVAGFVTVVAVTGDRPPFCLKR